MIKAIETHYKGYRFRSRLEARWAVFFDEIGVPWRYELRGVVLLNTDSGDECYLPDFLVGLYGAGHTWFEVKPYVFDEKGLTPETVRTLRIMTQLCYMPVEGVAAEYFAGFVAGGDPGAQTFGVLALPMYHDGSMGEYNTPVVGAVNCAFARLAICPCCGKFSFFLAGIKDDPRYQVLCGCIDEAKSHVYVKPHQADRFVEAAVLVNAANAARSARFERGETPKVPRGRPRK
jgi:hypothetical protein